jgi:hypothetical protein
MSEPIYIDADIENADWPKRTWDLGPADDFIRWLATWPDEEVARFRRLPAYRAAPPEVKAAVGARLASRP